MKTFVVAKRLIKEIIKDKRSLALLLLAPVMALFLLKVVLTSSVSKPNIDVINGNSELISILKDNAKITELSSSKTALNHLKENTTDGYIEFRNNNVFIKIEGSDPSIANLTLGILNKALTAQKFKDTKKIISSLPIKVSSNSVSPKVNISYLYGSKDSTTFDAIAPLLMGFFIFFFVFLMAGVSFLRERISGTLERILSTPLKRFEIVWGYFFGFGIFVVIQTIVIQSFIIYALKVPTNSNFFAILLINLLLAAGSLSLGTLLSAFARNEFQLFQFIPVVIVPQMLFSGVFDLREAPAWVLALSKVFPLSYGADALRNVMIRGKSIGYVWLDLVILLGYALLFIILNSLALKKYRSK